MPRSDQQPLIAFGPPFNFVNESLAESEVFALHMTVSEYGTRARN